MNARRIAAALVGIVAVESLVALFGVAHNQNHPDNRISVFWLLGFVAVLMGVLVALAALFWLAIHLWTTENAGLGSAGDSREKQP